MKIILLGRPISTQHAYLQRGKMRFMRKEAQDLKTSYAKQAKAQHTSPIITDPVRIEIRLYFNDKRVRDWDNWHKLSMDALTGIVWQDDSQILDARVIKMEIDKANPRIEIDILTT